MPSAEELEEMLDLDDMRQHLEDDEVERLIAMAKAAPLNEKEAEDGD